MDHSAGSEVVFGTDFMIPAGIRLDLFNATAKLPGGKWRCWWTDEEPADTSRRMDCVSVAEMKNIFRNSRRLGAAHCRADPDDHSVPDRVANSSTIDEYH
ncbi:Eukaryotic/viral aspartic protease [Phytophthora megakarya]|uniref:Eukaryotic/viral aspartic protease n=1 Tax=Phytophthora megakarya TaxID=4795 RepID=A0A225WBJ9_9STRA|nr:Eukaryotic/viral aspartic protease [Phytophthora megakarya]